MRLMGLTAADVADPDSVPARASTRANASRSCAAGAAALRNAPPPKSGSPVASSAAGLSYSASLRGDSEPILNLCTNTKASLNLSSGGGECGVEGSKRLSSLFTSPADRSAASLRVSARTVSFDTPPLRAAAAPQPASRSEALKEDGNRAFEAGLFAEAIRYYSAAIDALGQSDTAADGAPRSAAVELEAALYSNRSAAYLQAARQWSSAEEAYARALCDADRAVALRPSWFKGYTRQGDAYFKLRRYGTAAEAYEMALQLDPRNATLSNALAETRLRAKQAAREELELRRTVRSTATTTVALHKSSLNSTERSGDEEGRRFAYGDDDGARSPVTASAAVFGPEGARATGTARRLSGQAQQLWENLKHEVEVITHAPTGDAYRLQQLERFRSRGGAAAAEARRSETQTLNGASARSEERSGPRATPASTAASYHTTPMLGSETETPSTATTRLREDRPAETTPSSFASWSSSVAATTATVTATPAAAAPAPVSPPPRSSYASPTAGGIPAAMANFSGPVTNARDVPYEFSSAAASAYQQKLLEAFRQRKGKQTSQ